MAATLADFVATLDVLLRAKYSLIAVNTYEEERACRAVLQVAAQEKHATKPVFTWSRTRGLLQIKDATGLLVKPVPVDATQDPAGLLDHLAQAQEGLFILCDFAPYLAPYGQEDPLLARAVRELAWRLRSTRAAVILLGPAFPELPALAKEVRQLDLPLPDVTEVTALVASHHAGLAERDEPGLELDHTPETQAHLAQALLGLTHSESENALAQAIIRSRGLHAASLPYILEEKQAAIRGTRALTYVHPEPLENLGGYAHLRAVLQRAAYTFSPAARARRVEPCKGILLVGLPGCGKDLTKRIASGITGRALVDLDFGAVMGEAGGIVGQAAMSIRRALAIAGTLQGILGLSEFEKAVSGLKSSARSDGGETARTISYLLNWMQEQEEVLVFATANDVRELEAEQFRLGRFSHILFVDLPDAADRAAIFRVHLLKRALDPGQFDLAALAAATHDFSGAEIEQAVKNAILEAFIDGDRPPETADVLTAARAITPTAQMMSEKISALRAWAKRHLTRAGQPARAVTQGPRQLDL